MLGSDRPTIGLLNKFLRVDVVTKWKDLGRCLLGPSHTGQLDVIELNSPKNVEECCTKMFECWLNVDPFATWDKVIAALRYIGLNTLSERIKTDLLKGMYGMVI